MKIPDSKDFYAGLMFILFGVIAIQVARNYPLGTVARMGPGYFPSVLGGILTLIGFIISIRVLWVRDEPIGQWAVRPLMLVTGAVIAFAFLVVPLGLVLATLALLVISAFANWEFHLRETAILCLVLVLFAVGLFVYGLGLTFTIWPR